MFEYSRNVDLVTYKMKFCIVVCHIVIAFCSCTFEGTHDELKAHLEKCKFEGLKGFLSRTDDHLEELQEEMKRKDEEIMFLRSMLASLSEKVDHMEKTAVTKIGRECFQLDALVLLRVNEAKLWWTSIA